MRNSRSSAVLRVLDDYRNSSADELESFAYWHGASGRRYVHTIYPLRECPDVVDAVYVMVRTSANGDNQVVRVGQTESTSGTLNLADIRFHAARLGADTVHVHLLAETPTARRLVELDLQAGLFGALSSEADQPIVEPDYAVGQ